MRDGADVFQNTTNKVLSFSLSLPCDSWRCGCLSLALHCQFIPARFSVFRSPAWLIQEERGRVKRETGVPITFSLSSLAPLFCLLRFASILSACYGSDVNRAPLQPTAISTPGNDHRQDSSDTCFHCVKFLLCFPLSLSLRLSLCPSTPPCYSRSASCSLRCYTTPGIARAQGTRHAKLGERKNERKDIRRRFPYFALQRCLTQEQQQSGPHLRRRCGRRAAEGAEETGGKGRRSQR